MSPCFQPGKRKRSPDLTSVDAAREKGAASAADYDTAEPVSLKV
jgi:hypothetical protein